MILYISDTGELGMGEELPPGFAPIAICEQEYCDILLSFLGLKASDFEDGTTIIISEIADAETREEQIEMLMQVTLGLAKDLQDYFRQKNGSGLH